MIMNLSYQALRRSLPMVQVKACIVSAGLVGLGLLIVLLSESVGRWRSFHPAVLALPLFVGFNVFLAARANLLPQLRQYWDPGRAVLFFPGALLGTVLVLLPFLLAKPLGVGIAATGNFSWGVGEAAMTLCIVAWEELWFRGLALNYLARRTTRPRAALFFAVLFVGLHALNPKIRLIGAAPNLFLASLLLASAYFSSRSIYLPLGLHFSWNHLNERAGPLIFGITLPQDFVWGDNGLAVGVALTLGTIAAAAFGRKNQSRT